LAHVGKVHERNPVLPRLDVSLDDVSEFQFSLVDSVRGLPRPREPGHRDHLGPFHHSLKTDALGFAPGPHGEEVEKTEPEESPEEEAAHRKCPQGSNALRQGPRVTVPRTRRLNQNPSDLPAPTTETPPVASSLFALVTSPFSRLYFTVRSCRIHCSFIG